MIKLQCENCGGDLVHLNGDRVREYQCENCHVKFLIETLPEKEKGALVVPKPISFYTCSASYMSADFAREQFNKAVVDMSKEIW